ncbi:hypothetical protein [Tardiphaga sp. 11_C7_N12_6]|uniref:hypothetical protein n=1 Tax=Tardiphaga sp. 11_C7_N12_6 TaxID=3240789 RepID=UPI003F25F6D8
MFFERRRWAVRLLDHMGHFAGSRQSTALIDLLIWASKSNAPEAAPFSRKKRDQIIGWGIIMFNNPTATEKLARDARISESDAYNLLKKMKESARQLAQEHGLATLIHIADASDAW